MNQPATYAAPATATYAPPVHLGTTTPASDLFALLWTRSQTSFHIESVTDMLTSNFGGFVAGRGMDYVPIFIGTDDQCHEAVHQLREIAVKWESVACWPGWEVSEMQADARLLELVGTVLRTRCDPARKHADTSPAKGRWAVFTVRGEVADELQLLVAEAVGDHHADQG